MRLRPMTALQAKTRLEKLGYKPTRMRSHYRNVIGYRTGGRGEKTCTPFLIRSYGGQYYFRDGSVDDGYENRSLFTMIVTTVKHRVRKGDLTVFATTYLNEGKPDFFYPSFISYKGENIMLPMDDMIFSLLDDKAYRPLFDYLMDKYDGKPWWSLDLTSVDKVQRVREREDWLNFIRTGGCDEITYAQGRNP